MKNLNEVLQKYNVFDKIGFVDLYDKDGFLVITDNEQFDREINKDMCEELSKLFSELSECLPEIKDVEGIDRELVGDIINEKINERKDRNHYSDVDIDIILTDGSERRITYWKNLNVYSYLTNKYSDVESLLNDLFMGIGKLEIRKII